MTNAILDSMLEKFDGCEGGDPGGATKKSTWLFGIEPGWSRFDQEKGSNASALVDNIYSLDTQLAWPYNRNAFKLLAAIDGSPVTQYLEFSRQHQPFVKGSTGYFKGNLYPYACNALGDWPEYAVQETGFLSKAEYQNWCKDFRWPAIKSWVDEYQPKLFIGVGNTFKEQFALSTFGRQVELQLKGFEVNGHVKKIYCANVDGRKLAVVPHLSGGRNGLNSDKAIEQAGALIRELLAG